MNDLLVALAAVFTASAAVVGLLFELCWADTAKLQEDLVRKANKKNEELDPGKAAALAAKTRRRQKLYSLGLVLTLALLANLAALFVDSSADSTQCTATCPPSQASAVDGPASP